MNTQPAMTSPGCHYNDQHQTRQDKIDQFRRTWGDMPEVDAYIQDSIDQFGDEWPDMFHCDLDISEDFQI